MYWLCRAQATSELQTPSYFVFRRAASAGTDSG